MTFTYKKSLLEIAFLVACGVWIGAAMADDPKPKTDDVIEKGKVAWSSDLKAAKLKSKATGRPVFLLFQEIPG